MAHVVMAYRVTAHVVMAHVVMAYRVTANVVMANIVMAYIVMAHIVIAPPRPSPHPARFSPSAFAVGIAPPTRSRNESAPPSALRSTDAVGGRRSKRGRKKKVGGAGSLYCLEHVSYGNILVWQHISYGNESETGKKVGGAGSLDRLRAGQRGDRAVAVARG